MQMTSKSTGCPPSAMQELQNIISTCIDDVAKWMSSNRLQLNAAKTRGSLVYIHSPPSSNTSVTNPSVHRKIKPVSVVRNLDIYIDTDMSMCRISRRLSMPASRSCVSWGAFIVQFDYGNATLAGICASVAA